MGTICGANCDECRGRDECRGCAETCGSPGGRAAYDEFRRQLLDEINSLLEAEGLPHALALYELPGQYVNLEYPTPGGERVRLLSDNDIYLGTQIEFADLGICYGVIADTGFILICSYSRDGSDPEIVVFKRR